MFHSRILQYLDAGQVTKYSYHIGSGVQFRKPLLITVDDRDVISFIAEHLGKVRTYFTCAFNDDYHSPMFSNP